MLPSRKWQEGVSRPFLYWVVLRSSQMAVSMWDQLLLQIAVNSTQLFQVTFSGVPPSLRPPYDISQTYIVLPESCAGGPAFNRRVG